ncbi:YXWGXW repeat-containing protein [Burkholderia pseudomallei]
MNRRHFRRRLSFVGASLAGLGFGRGSATQQPPGPPSSPPRSFAGPPRAGAAPSRAAAVSGPPRAAASAASARAPPAPPRPRGYVWTNGYWRWPGGRSVWIPGRWIAQRPGHRGSPAIGDNGQTCGSISTDAGIACAASRTPFAAKAAKRIGEREAAAHRRRRTPRARFRRSDLSNAPARPRGPETNQRRGKRARTPAAARGFLTTAPNDAIASIAGFHRP